MDSETFVSECRRAWGPPNYCHADPDVGLHGHISVASLINKKSRYMFNIRQLSTGHIDHFDITANDSSHA